MSTRGKIAASLTSAGIVALGWHQFAGTAPASGNASQQTAQPTAQSTATVTVTKTTTAQATSGTESQTSDHSTSAAQTTSSSTSSNSSGYKDGTYTGQTIQYRFGQLSISVTIKNGKITTVTENIQSDGEMRSEMINQQAVPMLHSEVVSANSAQVSTIGGATYTSEAYLQSLQSALDQA